MDAVSYCCRQSRAAAAATLAHSHGAKNVLFLLLSNATVFGGDAVTASEIFLARFGVVSLCLPCCASKDPDRQEPPTVGRERAKRVRKNMGERGRDWRKAGQPRVLGHPVPAGSSGCYLQWSETWRIVPLPGAMFESLDGDGDVEGHTTIHRSALTVNRSGSWKGFNRGPRATPGDEGHPLVALGKAML